MSAGGDRYEWIDALGARHGLSPWAGKDELRRGLVGLLLARAGLCVGIVSRPAGSGRACALPVLQPAHSAV
jgi:hypothetical protein